MYGAAFIGAFMAELAAQQEEHRRFEASLEGLSAEEVADRRAKRAEIAKERTIERRHQELCRAISNSKPRGLGIFW